MVSTMRCCARLESLLLCLALCFVVVSARAADVVIQSAQLVANDDGYSLSANFSINLGSRLEAAVNKGVVFYFAADFEMTRSRWYWFDEKVVQRNKTFQLSYHALTRQYRLASGALHQSFASLDDALRVLSRLLVSDSGRALWSMLPQGPAMDAALVDDPTLQRELDARAKATTAAGTTARR